MRSARWKGQAAIGAALVVAVCAALGGQSSAAVKAKPVLVVAGGTAPNYNPLTWADGWNSEDLVYESFVTLAPNYTLTPSLATSWRYLEAAAGSGLANKRLELTLRRGARFSDGTPVTARAIKTWFDYVTKNKSIIYNKVGDISSVTTDGKWGVVITVKAPNPVLLNDLSNGLGDGSYSTPASPKCVARPSLFKKKTCGAGPYEIDFSQSVLGDHDTFVPNPYYYDKSKQHWSKIIVKSVSTPSSLLQTLQVGQADVGDGDTSTAAAAQSAGFAVSHGPQINVMLVLDVGGKTSKALKDVRVRQALNYAVDRKTLTAAFAGKWGVATSEVGTFDGFDSKYQNHYPYNPAKAKQLLAAAGYAQGLSLDVLSLGPFGATGTPLIEALAKEWQDVGIKVNVVPAATYGDFGAKYTSFPVWQAPFGVDSMWVYYTFMIPPFTSNHWFDPALSKIWAKSLRAKDPFPYWKQISDRATDEALYVPILIKDRLLYVNTKKVDPASVQIGRRGRAIIGEWRPAK
jgi:peptide/nickel transport system substrate-binding protein